MSEKKYLLTATELHEYGMAISNQLGMDILEAMEFIDKLLTEHEYHERTCRNKIIEINRRTPPEYRFRTDDFVCTACGEHFFADSEYINHPIDWAFCPNCGAKVVDE